MTSTLKRAAVVGLVLTQLYFGCGNGFSTVRETCTNMCPSDQNFAASIAGLEAVRDSGITKQQVLLLGFNPSESCEPEFVVQFDETVEGCVACFDAMLDFVWGD